MPANPDSTDRLLLALKLALLAILAALALAHDQARHPAMGKAKTSFAP